MGREPTDDLAQRAKRVIRPGRWQFVRFKRYPSLTFATNRGAGEGDSGDENRAWTRAGRKPVHVGGTGFPGDRNDGPGRVAAAANEYNDKVDSVSGSRSYDADANQTTFSFTIKIQDGTATISHLVISTCPQGAEVVTATGGQQGDYQGNQNDPTTDRTGAKFEPGRTGTYTVVFAGDITGAEIALKNGNGYEVFFAGSGCDEGSEVTTSSTTTSTAGQGRDRGPVD